MSAVPTQQMSDIAAPMPTNFQHVQVMNINQSVDIGRKYAKIYHNLGVTQVILGAISIAIGATLLELAAPGSYNRYDGFSLISTGIWSGAFFIVSGILGIVCGKKPQYCHSLNFYIVAAMVMTIFSTIAAIVLLGFETAGAVVIGTSADNYNYYRYDFWETSTALHAVLALVGFTEFIIAIVHSAYCCAPTCCSPQPKMYVPPGNAYAGQNQTSGFPQQQVAFVHPGYNNPAMMHSNQQLVPMYYHPPTAPLTTNQEKSTVPSEASALTGPTSAPPAYQGVEEMEKL